MALLLKENSCAKSFYNSCINNCRSYGPNKLIYVTFKCNLDHQPTEKCLKRHFPSSWTTIFKSMHKCRRYDPEKSGLMHTRTYTRTHIHLSKLVAALSRSTASGLDKKEYSYSIHVIGCNNIQRVILSKSK